MKDEPIINLEIKGLPRILKERTTYYRVTPRNQREATLCTGYTERFEFGHKCGPKNHVVRLYNVPHLHATFKFYEELAKKPTMLALLGDVRYVAPTQIEEICQAYFSGFGLEIPDPRDEQAYEAFLNEHSELGDFNFMATEADLVNTVLSAEPRPKDYDGMMQRMEQVLPKQYYLQIRCCEEHLEATILHAINLTWHKYTAETGIAPTSRADMDVYEDSLIYAPDSQNGIVVQLCRDITPTILGMAYAVEHRFRNLMLKQS